MSNFILLFLNTLFVVTCVQSQLIWETPSNLQPVHGLYVKPSEDGTTGDLYVAATEEDGVNSQWLNDQPINFLAAAASQNEPTTLPLSFTTTVASDSSPQEKSVTTQKRAVLTAPPVTYTYAVPAASENKVLLPYPYAAPTTEKTEESSSTPCSNAVPHYSPFQYFYPQMLSAIANAFNTYKQPSNNDETTTANQALPAWPTTYAYPFQYVMVDPRAWASQVSTPQPTTSVNQDAS